MLELLLVEPPSYSTYQDLSVKYSAIEPPTWCLLLAESVRTYGKKSVDILDCNAERLSYVDSAKRIVEASPRLVCFVVYGQNPNSGTVNMEGALKVAQEVKRINKDLLICFVGSHSSALPLEVLAYPCVDIVLLNEGVYALHHLLNSTLPFDLPLINGIGYKKNGVSILNSPERIVPESELETVLPGYAWDLLPYVSTPLDLYRAHYWHTNYSDTDRTPFAAIYTSLGCRFKCSFCMINILNRTDNSDGITSADSPVMRHWPTRWVTKQITILREQYGVKAIRFSDEMFFLNKKHYQPILDFLIEAKYDLTIWAYSRVDTIRKDSLEKFKLAGIKWLALGIESANQTIRQEITKGKFADINIKEIVKLIEDAGINVVGNYIFGFPNETLEHLQQTLDLAIELNTAFANFYCAAALPGSPLYYEAKTNGWDLPTEFSEYGFFSYDCKPLPTNYLYAKEVLRFRDYAWTKYYTNVNFLNKVESLFGRVNRLNVESMAKVKLKRKLLEYDDTARTN